MAAVCVASSPSGSSSTPSIHRGEEENPRRVLLQTLGDLLSQEDFQSSSERFQRAPDTAPLDSSTPDHDNYSDDKVPVIDLSALRYDDDARMQQLVEDVASSCRDWGFFQVINHGVPRKVLAAARLQSEMLFNLPLRQKSKGEQRSSGESGYASSVRAKETGLPWSEGFVIHLRPESHEESIAQRLGLGEAQNEEFCHAIREYSAALHRLGLSILDLIIRGLPGDNTRAHFEEVSRFNNYMEKMEMELHLSCPQPELQLNLSSYTDANILTILHQGSTGSLQIFRAGQWVAVEPFPHALCVHGGDMLEILTNGRYKSVLQRVLVDKKQERLSLAFIMSPWDKEAAVGPAPDLILVERQCCYQTVTWGHYRDEKSPSQGPLRYDYF